jgi:5-hydroxyisourate hydrolase-like protein (transthyretin family)
MPAFEMRFGDILLVSLLMSAAQPSCRTMAAEPVIEIAGEVGQLQGHVVRASTGEPAVEADVRLISRPLDNFTLPLVPKRVRSNKDGEFTFDGLDPGTYLVYAFLGNESSREKKFVFEKVVIDEQRRQTKPIELQLKPGVTLRVRVASQATGERLPTAKIRFRWTDADDDFRANDQGEILVPALTPEQWHLEITAPGHSCDIRDVRLVGPETVFAVSLAPGGEVTGRVVDEKGGPLAGAKLSVQVEHQAMYTLDQSTANEKGEFRLQYLPLGTPLRLAISHAGFDRFDASLSVPSQVPVDRGSVQLTPLPDGGTISGQVVDNGGQPIVGAALQNQGTSSINQNTTHTDTNGQFHIERLYVFTEGRVLLIVHAKGFAPRQIDVTDNDRQGNTPFKIVLEPGHRIRGRVLNRADEPIAACRVYFAEGNHANLLGGQLQSDSEGRFESDSLPPNCPFAFYAHGYSELDIKTLPLDQGDEVIVRLEPIGLIRGQVVDAVTAKPISEFNVRIAFPSRPQPDDKQLLGITSTRMSPGEDFVVADGRFELPGLTNGSVCDVVVQTKGYHRVRLVRVQAAPEGEAETVAVRLQPIKSGDLTKVGGVIRGPDGSPAADVQVRLVGTDKHAEAPRKETLYSSLADGRKVDPGNRYDEFRTAVTNANGEFKFDEVPQGLALQLV